MDQNTKKSHDKVKHLRNTEKYRKFVGSNSAGQGFADMRKRKTQYEYLKMLKKLKREGQQSQQHKATTTSMLPSQEKTYPKESKKKQKKDMSRYSKAVAESNRRKAERKKKKEEAERRQKEQEEAKQRSVVERREKFLKLCKRTHKGQPVMRYQMEHLLQQIEKQQQKT